MAHRGAPGPIRLGPAATQECRPRLSTRLGAHERERFLRRPLRRRRFRRWLSLAWDARARRGVRGGGRRFAYADLAPIVGAVNADNLLPAQDAVRAAVVTAKTGAVRACDLTVEMAPRRVRAADAG